MKKYAAAKYLIIVESPSKCKKIETFLGEQYACIASKGHLRSLNSLKSINKETFEIEFENIVSKSGHISWMRGIINLYDKQNVILATDNDREGEAIAWHICVLFGLSVATTQRIIFSEITESVIRMAVSNPTVINMNLVYAQHARQILDVLVGFQISPLLWKYLFFDKTKQHALSAGRCQTPALRIIQERAQGAWGEAILQYKINAYFFPKQLCFSLTSFVDPGDVKEFMKLSKTHNHCMTIGDPARKTYAPPAPFNTSGLLQTVSNRLHISPNETMQICQVLYQAGLITYMRSECKKYCKEFLEKARIFVVGEYSEKHVGDLEKIQNEDKFPHEAIRVTDLNVKKGNLGDGTYDTRTVSVYHLIWLNTVQTCMATAEYTTVRLSMTAPMDLSYMHILETPVFLGWRQTGLLCGKSQSAYGAGGADNEIGSVATSEGAASLIFYLKSRSLTNIAFERMESAVSFSGGETHYTESALIQQLESLGIGRPSTYSSIIETIKEREYVKKQDIEGVTMTYTEYKMDGGIMGVGSGGVIQESCQRRVFGNERAKLKIQSLGQIVVDFLVDNFNTIFSYDYTSRMEADLDEIAKGVIGYSEICKKYNDELLSLIKGVKKGIKKNVYVIDSEHTLMFEKFGPVICKKEVLKDGDSGAGAAAPVFLSVNREITIDLEKLKAGKYTISELLETKPDLGEYGCHPIHVKHGHYGDYIECWDKKVSLKEYRGKWSGLTRLYVLGLLGVSDGDEEGVTEAGGAITRHFSKNAVLRKFSEELCIKNGRYGAYAFHSVMGNKPQFLNIKKFKGDWRTCPKPEFLQWIQDTHGVVCQNDSV
jgi:DNA topoisomerase-1